MDYADTARAAFRGAGGRWANWASFIRKLLNTFLFFSQLLSNAVYVLFIAQNIKPVNHNSLNLIRPHFLSMQCFIDRLLLIMAVK